MHMWAPEAPESKEHLARMDDLIGQAMHAAPDAAFLLTADHGMNAKTLCWDLEKSVRTPRGSAPKSFFRGARPLREAASRLQSEGPTCISKTRKMRTGCARLSRGLKGWSTLLLAMLQRATTN